jgi:hypothetical protein
MTPGVRPPRETPSAPHSQSAGQIPRCFAMKPNFTTIPWRSRPRLFLGCLARPSIRPKNSTNIQQVRGSTLSRRRPSAPAKSMAYVTCPRSKCRIRSVEDVSHGSPITRAPPGRAIAGSPSANKTPSQTRPEMAVTISPVRAAVTGHVVIAYYGSQ